MSFEAPWVSFEAPWLSFEASWVLFEAPWALFEALSPWAEFEDKQHPMIAEALPVECIRFASKESFGD
jgi:hypothetical protein